MEKDSHPTRLGQITTRGRYATLSFERILHRPPEEVWDALTRPEQLTGWYMTKARIDAREGGEIDFLSGPSQFHVTGRILVWDPPRVFEHEWNVEPRPELPLGERAIIRWELTRERDETLLRLTHSRLSPQTALGFAPGTHAFLDRLEAYLNHGSFPNWLERYQEVQGKYPKMRRM